MEVFIALAVKEIPAQLMLVRVGSKRKPVGIFI